MAWVKQTCETIAVEGGAEAKTPQQQHQAAEAAYELLHQAVRTIPRRHRLGWYQATARTIGQPISDQPSQNELDYHAWSQRQLAGPRASKTLTNASTQVSSATMTDTGPIGGSDGGRDA